MEAKVKKKRMFYLFLCFKFLIIMFCQINLFAESDVLKVISSNRFGADNNNDFFYDSYKNFCISNDGFIFVSNGRQHNISKFTIKGQFISKFGQKGEGPGDLYGPGNLAVLDNKYLIVSEYATKRRISMFDLTGKFAKIIKTKRNVWRIGALNNNYIYYESATFEKNKNKHFTGQYSFKIIKNINSGKEIIVDKTFFNYYMYSDRKNLLGVYLLAVMRGYVVAKDTPKGNLLVGLTNTPILKEFSVNGKLLREIHLQIHNKLVTNKIIDNYKNMTIKIKTKDMMEDKRWPKYQKKKLIKAYKSMPYKKFFKKTLPYYDWFLVDKNGNIIIIINYWSKDIWVKLYSSKDGSLIKQKKYIDKRYIFDTSQLVYSSKYGLYGFFQKRDSDETDIRIIKLDW
jgi:hypothetical protein